MYNLSFLQLREVQWYTGEWYGLPVERSEFKTKPVLHSWARYFTLMVSQPPHKSMVGANC